MQLLKTTRFAALSLCIFLGLIGREHAPAQHPREASEFFQDRRQQLVRHMEQGSMAVMMSSAGQQSSFYYLTGYTHPEAAFILQPNQEHEFILFLPPKDSVGGMWRRQEYGLADGRNVFGAVTTYDIAQFEQIFKQKLQSESIIYLDPNDQSLMILFINSLL